MARVNIGGQAVLEGVMMKGKSHMQSLLEKQMERLLLRQKNVKALWTESNSLSFLYLEEWQCL